MPNVFDKQEEEELIRRARDGDDSAFDALVEATKHASYAVAYRWTRDQHTALDMVQEAYLRLHATLPTWRNSCRLQTWLYRVVTNVCIDHHRHRRFEVVGPSDAAGWACDPDACEPPASEALERSDQVKVLQASIEQLPGRMRQAVHLRYLCGLSLQEVSTVQGCSIGTIKSTLFEAVRRLRSHMGRYERCTP
ncbi:MAG: hypothetical protein A3K19_28060 [Lentisphaerae bacterium RIFOXYB12_FULL_65_16]|nr:MAG: hypothetical protein A3K18_27865 [Lentisphaerae bacterium RIFOXYA12_64_32]OGV88146.1 MAG: hypothetical protein A3K19_28060 [Lentisphaerae bacterium RIFOXYB12_FULL_65_16]